MAKYRCITRLQTKDKTIHEVGDFVEMDDEEGAIAVKLKSAVLVQEEPAQETPAPADAKNAPPKSAGKTAAQPDTASQPAQSAPATDSGSDVK